MIRGGGTAPEGKPHRLQKSELARIDLARPPAAVDL